MHRPFPPVSAVLAGPASSFEPHLPVDRLADGTWAFAPFGAMLVARSGAAVVCHACGAALTAVSAGHLRRHELTLAAYRERFGLNRKASLLAPALADKRRVEGRRRWRENAGVQSGLAVGQELARRGALHALGASAQPVGARRRQGRVAASREGASPALRADRERRSSAARARWEVAARARGFEGLDAYLVARRAEGASAHRVRTELGCGGTAAERLLRGDQDTSTGPTGGAEGC